MEAYPLKWITKSLALSYAPRAREHLQAIQSAGIGAIVNLCAECYDLNEVEAASGFEVYYLPIEDEAAPDLEELGGLLAWMNRQIQSGNSVLVHCRYGIGRTGTVVMAFLLHSGITFEMAREMMRHTPAWPSSRVQKQLIDRYCEKVFGVSGATRFSGGNMAKAGKYFERIKAALKWSD